MTNNIKPSVFIGSSSEGEDVARALETHLVGVAETTLWCAGVFGLSQSTLDTLVNILDRFDVAVLVVTPDDVVVSRGTESQRARDNVMFELGLFMGRLTVSQTLVSLRDVLLPKLLSGGVGVKA